MRSRYASVLISTLLMAAPLVACGGQEAAGFDSSPSDYTVCTPDAPCPQSDDPLLRYDIERNMADGDSFEIPLDPARKLQQITMIYDGQYRVPELDAQGQPRLNGEGDTYYKDGIYAHGFVIGADGSKQEVSEPKFVNAHETDNWHDLRPLSGVKLHVDFSHADQFRNDPAVVAAATKVRMSRIIVQYRDPDGLTSEIFDYDVNDYLRSNAEIPNGGEFGIDFDGSKQIYRVDVRWGDAKPRAANGIYVPGRANGYLTVDGYSSERRNVAVIETQAFAGFDVVSVPAPQKHRIAVHMNGDNGRVHWIKVFYR